MAVYPKAVKRLIRPGATDPRITATQIIYHTAVMKGKSLHDFFAHRSGGIESHFYVRYNGTVEQYRDTAYQADANYLANDRAISIETEGFAGEKWTPAQVRALVALTVWLLRTHKGIMARKCPSWRASGIGYHSQYPQWSPVVKSCPGRKRIRQVRGIRIAAEKAAKGPQGLPYPGLATFRLGHRSPAVTALGRRLKARGYGRFYEVGPGPVFGPADRRAVARFQKDHGLKSSGRVTRRTWRVLFS